MAVAMRLTRVGGKKDPQTDPSTSGLNEERIRHWLERGAQPSEPVQKLLKTQGI